MPEYKAPLRDISFLINELLDSEQLPIFHDIGPEVPAGVVDEQEYLGVTGEGMDSRKGLLGKAADAEDNHRHDD